MRFVRELPASATSPLITLHRRESVDSSGLSLHRALIFSGATHIRVNEKISWGDGQRRQMQHAMLRNLTSGQILNSGVGERMSSPFCTPWDDK